ncbi:helix-turn-helix transcriptional regulator [Sphaerisporangium aureirubrum]|uniref:AAA family ATPase n=1 Tax=Sphaerisporangium aureirubrum TaxID=1544736 RepID=A0ABW1NTA9_9ACTN
MTITTQVFVGRGPELAAIEGELDRVRAGRPRLVLVEGPPGIGKTALVRRALAAADFHVLRASGEEMEQSLPYGVASQLLEQAAHHSAGPHPEATAFPADAGPQAAGAVLLGALGEAQGRGPVAVLVDDAHWADASSLRALTFALRRLRADRVLTVVVVPEVTDARIPEGLRRLCSREASLQLTLSGLSERELGVLGDRLGYGRLDGAALARLRAQTGGNPLYAAATLRQTPPDVLRDPGADLPAPGGYAREVLAALAATGEDTRRLVRAASVLGESCLLRHAGVVAGLPDPLDAVEDAVTHHLLTCRYAGGEAGVAFPHPLTRASVYQAIGPRERARAHRRAEALTTDQAKRLQHRMRATARPDVELIAELARFARDQAAAGSWESAAEYFGHAGDFTASARERARFGAEAVHALLQAGQVARATAVAPRAYGDHVTRAFAMGSLAQATGDVEGAMTLLDDAWRHCDPERDATLAGRTAHHLSVLHLIQDRGQESLSWSRRALELAGHQPGADLLHYYHVVSLFLSGHVERAIELTRTLPDPAMATSGELDALVGRGALRIWCDDLAGARRDLAGAAAAPRRLSVQHRLLATGLLSMAEYRLGHWDEGLALGTTVLSIEEDCEQYWLTPYVHTVQALSLAARGETERARGHVRGARRHALSRAAAGHLAHAEGWIAVVEGDLEAAVSALAPLTEVPASSVVLEPGVIPWQDLLADVYTALGEYDAADAVLITYEKAAGSRALASAMAGAARARGTWFAAQGRTADATAAFERALRHIAGTTMPFERARIELAYGAFLRRAGGKAAAAGHLVPARRTLERLGAVPFLAHCDRELAACGRPSSPAPGFGHPALTPQEHTVAQFVLAGMANKQIARQMVLSVKTVEYHLGHIYAKLGVSSRSALAARLRGDRS